MIKDALQHLEDRFREASRPQTVEIEGRRYYRTKDGTLAVVKRSEECRPDVLGFHTLTALVAFMEGEAKGFKSPALLVRDHSEVLVVGPLDPTNFNNRFVYAKAEAADCGFTFGRYLDLESFIIGVQAQFVRTERVEAILGLLASVVDENVKENADDGFSQSIRIRTGITLKAEVKVENPIPLAPYRTFREVQQPESNFIIRFKKSDSGLFVALFEADGGAWKNEAAARVRQFLAEKLPGQVIYA
jgi:hypothetical protein